MTSLFPPDQYIPLFMPQFDLFLFFSQSFLLLFSIILFYLLFLKFFLVGSSEVLKVRSKLKRFFLTVLKRNIDPSLLSMLPTY